MVKGELRLVRPMRKSLLTFAALSVVCAHHGLAQGTTSSSAQPPTPPEPPWVAACVNDPAHHLFDFWLGEWDVTTKGGTKVGTSVIQSVSNGCAILENWSGLRGGTGKSLNSYNPQLKQWQQFWVGADGGVSEFRSSESDGTTLAFFNNEDAPQKLRRLTFTPLDEDTVRQHSESSEDGGKSWTTQYDFYYHRRN